MHFMIQNTEPCATVNFALIQNKKIRKFFMFTLDFCIGNCLHAYKTENEDYNSCTFVGNTCFCFHHNTR